jgi:hypothetical protein
MGFGSFAFAMRTSPLHKPKAKQDERKAQTPLKAKLGAHGTRLVSNTGFVKLSPTHTLVGQFKRRDLF